MPLMKLDSSRSGAPAAWMSGTLASSSIRIAELSLRARCAPGRKCGPAAPKTLAACGSRANLVLTRCGRSPPVSGRLVSGRASWPGRAACVTASAAGPGQRAAAGPGPASPS